MRRLLVVLSVVAVLLCLTSSAAFAAEVVLNQGLGSPDDLFTFSGQGFSPGTEIAVDVVTPDKQQFFLEQNGQPATLVVDSNGAFALDFLPSTDLPGMPDGTFVFTFTDLTDGSTYTVNVEISTAAATSEVDI